MTVFSWGQERGPTSRNGVQVRFFSGNWELVGGEVVGASGARATAPLDLLRNTKINVRISISC